jgi:hypothetical protein
MAIPQPIDYRLAELDAMATGIVASLRILHHTGGDGRVLRERLKDFADRVIELANETVANQTSEQ